MSIIKNTSSEHIIERRRTCRDGSTSVRYGYSFVVKAVTFSSVCFATREAAVAAYRQKLKEVQRLIKCGKKILPAQSRQLRAQQKLWKILGSKGWRPLAHYTNCRRPLQVRCLVCSATFDIIPAHFDQGAGCPGCRRLKAASAARQKVRETGFELLSDYRSHREKVKIRCRRCGKVHYRSLKAHWNHPSCICRLRFDWSRVRLRTLKSDYLGGHLSLRDLAKKYKTSQPTLSAKFSELRWKRPPIARKRREDGPSGRTYLPHLGTGASRAGRGRLPR